MNVISWIVFWIVIALIVWTLVSIPVALIFGRWLRFNGRNDFDNWSEKNRE